MSGGEVSLNSSQPYLAHWPVLILPMREQVDPRHGDSTEDGSRCANGRNAHERKVATEDVAIEDQISLCLLHRIVATHPKMPAAK